MAGAPGFEPGIAGPKPAALPLGYAPSQTLGVEIPYTFCHLIFQRFHLLPHFAVACIGAPRLTHFSHLSHLRHPPRRAPARASSQRHRWLKHPNPGSSQACSTEIGGTMDSLDPRPFGRVL